MKGAPLEAAAASCAPERRTLQAEIAALMQDFSIEKTPGEVALLRSLPADLPRGSRVYITWITGNDFTRMLRAALRLRELGMQPVPHLAARAIPNVEALETMLAALFREAGVDHALLNAGSARSALGCFDRSLAALATGQFERHFYPFGAFDATVAWAAAVARGDFRWVCDDRDIAV